MSIMSKRVLRNASMICPKCETRTWTQVWDYEDEKWWWWCEEICDDPIKPYTGNQ